MAYQATGLRSRAVDEQSGLGAVHPGGKRLGKCQRAVGLAAPREEVEGLVSPAGHRPDASEPERGDDGESGATVRLGFAESGFELALGLVELVPLPLHAGPCQPGLGEGGMVGSVEVHVHQRLVGQSLGLVQMSFDEMDLRQGGGCQEPVDGLWHRPERRRARHAASESSSHPHERTRPSGKRSK